MTQRFFTRSARLREALHDRHTLLAGGIAALTLLVLWIAHAVGTGDFTTAVLGVGLLAAPFLIVLALKRPYVFPYGLYLVAQPFENLFGGGPAGSLIRLIGVCATAAVLVLMFREHRAVKPPITVALACAYVVWALLSTMWAVDMNAALVDVQTLVSLLAMYAVLASAPITERDLRAIGVAIVGSGLALAIYGIWYFHQFPPTDDGRLAISVAGHSIDSNQFADTLLAPIAFALVALLHARRVETVLVTLATLAVLGEATIISLSREALLGCLGIAVVTIFMSRRRLLGFAIMAPIVAAVPFFVPTIAQRFLTAVSTGGAGRTSIWQVDLAAWWTHPIIGWGAGSAFQAYNANLLRISPRLFAGWGRPPHNVPLHALVDFGIVGLLLVAAAYLFSFRLLSLIRRGDPLYDLRVALTASLVAIGCVSFFIDNSVDKYVWAVLCAIAQLRTVAILRARAAPAAVAYQPPPLAAQPVRRFAR